MIWLDSLHDPGNLNLSSFFALRPEESGLKIKGDSRKLRLIWISGKSYLVAAVNNGLLQIFEVNNTLKK